ncbi:MAG TPA: division/cell wall cluster transcriptional repressor MraZ [Egibacteraceae bacterium]|nr:division/cell wall cluster transcriptional repressor MraZ [Egibacteraceae bacterium]
MFLGEYRHTLDPKGRLILPSAFREDLSEGLVLTMGMDRCLDVHPSDGWQRVVDGLRNLRSTDRRQRMFARMITSSAHPESLDRQGRITIPGRLREYAALSKDITVVGADSRLELWDTAAWETYREQAMGDFADTEQSFDLGVF